MVNSTHLAVAGSSKHQAAAWSFVEFVLTRPSSQVQIYKGKGIAPALMQAYDDAVFHEPSPFFSGQKKGEVFLDALKAPSSAFNYTADYARALKLVTDAQSKVLLGARTRRRCWGRPPTSSPGRPDARSPDDRDAHRPHGPGRPSRGRPRGPGRVAASPRTSSYCPRCCSSPPSRSTPSAGPS